MTKDMIRVYFPRMLWTAVFVFSLTMTAWAMHPNATAISNPNHGPSTLDDLCGDCAIDYTGLRWSGSGGQGGRGTIHWPGGATGNNYGQMVYASTCELGNPLYAWCTDIYHPAETQNYGVNVDPAVITDDSCRKAQLTAAAYLLAWTFPASTFEDDAMQLAIWKLANIRDGGANDGLPHFCYDAGIGYPNFGDAPVYPYVNTVYGTNAPRNDWANAKVLDAIGKNVVLPGDLMANEALGPFIVGDSTEAVLKFCLTRGAYAVSVNDTCRENIKLELLVQVDGDAPTMYTLYTDADGCVEIHVTQPLDDIDPVYVRICTKWAWPIAVVGCDEETFDNNQWLIISGQGQEICFPFEIPGDNWLSVELSAFDAYTTAEGVDLQWSTASEANAQRWEVYRSVAGADEFALISQLAAHNSSTGATYTYADRDGTFGTMYEYRLVDVDLGGGRTEHPGTATAVFGTGGATVLEYKLADAFPNPFNPTTSLSFTIPEAGKVALRIFDLSGREVATLVNGIVAAGEHRVDWNAEGMPSGTYFYSLTAANFTSTKKLLLLK